MTISITFTATPVLAQAVIDYPVGIIEVEQGDTFTLRHRLQWNDPDNPGTYVVAIYWDYFGDDSYHFTVVDNRAYFDEDGDDLPDPGTDPIEATFTFADDGSRFSAGVSAITPDPRDGTFNVELTLRASGPGGTPHVVTLDHPINYTTISAIEFTPVSVTPKPIGIRVTPWPGGVVVKGKTSAYNSNGAGIPPFVYYSPGEDVPIMAVQREGDGAVAAAGFTQTARNARWNDLTPVNPDPYLDVLLDETFQWMVLGAENVLWYYGYGTYVTPVATPDDDPKQRATDMVTALEALTYTVTTDNTEPITDIDFSDINILIISGLQTGDGLDGGDPSLLPDADVAAIESFVKGGGGLLIMESGDSFGKNFNRVQNKILDAFSFDWRFQNDQALDDVNNWGGSNWQPIAEVDPMTSIGGGYRAVTVTENIGLYSPCSLALVPTFDVEVSISPDEESAGAGEEVTFVATVHNTGDAWDTYTLDLSDDQGWPELSFLPKIATLQLEPDNDTHVCENFPDDVADGGVDYNMYVGWEGNPHEAGCTGWKTRAYLRFDVSGIPSGVSIISATLNAKVNYGPSTGFPSNFPDNMLVDVKAVSGDDWLESELTWDTAPAPGDTLDTTMVYDDTTAGKGVWYSWDVQGFVETELTGDGVVSLCMLSEEKEAAEIDCTVWFYTKDDGYPPYIEVTYPAPTTTKTVTLGPDESATFDIGVTIHPDSEFCDEDILTIDATSAYTETVVSGTAIAHSLGTPPTLRGVEVVIEPEEDNAELVVKWQDKRYDPLTFKVIVTNTGDLPDKYNLTAEGPEGWMLEILPVDLYIEPDKSDIAALSVTVPKDAQGGTSETITVTAHGKLTTGVGEDTIDAINSADATVNVLEARGVKVEILPWQTQTATPGSKLKWIVKVKNLGNVEDDYTLSINSIVEDNTETNYDNLAWNPTIIPGEILNLPGCTYEQAWLEVTIPDNMKTSIWNTITVTAKGTGVDDNATVQAHVLVPGPRVPVAEIKLTVETEVIAIDVWQTSWDFGVLDELENAETSDSYFTVRNIGNKPVNVTITGDDAKSGPGEPIATWTLVDPINRGLDRYVMWYGTLPTEVLKKAPGSMLVPGLLQGDEYEFDLKIEAPIAITVPSRMWTIVTLTAVEAAP